MRLRLVIALCLCTGILFCLSLPAWAAGATLVGKVDGKAYIVRGTNNKSHWLACWAEQGDGKSKLYVMDSNNGDVKLVATEDNPGGICWIPGRDELLWCRGVYNKVVDVTLVTYYVYSVADGKNRKVIEATDIADAYQADMIPADDGSALFHMTVSGSRIPSFNIYRPGEGQNGIMDMQQVDANIGAQYDLSSDGARLYWILHDPATGALNVPSWKIAAGKYDNLYEYAKATDPAEDHMFLKADTPNKQVATIVLSSKDPRLQLCVYSLAGGPVYPVYFNAGEQIEFFDWKGRTGTIYALVNNTTAKKYSVEEIAMPAGTRKQLYSTKDPVYSVDYGPDGDYYITWIDARNTKRIQTQILRIKP